MSRIVPKWIATLPLAALLAACASTAPRGGDIDQRAVIDFNSCAKPMYPHEELAAGHEGTVQMGFEVQADGTIGSSRVERSSGFPSLDEAALTALNKCRFHPARKNGQPVASSTDVKYVWVSK